MNLCEKSGGSINKDGRFCSPRKMMFFAEVKKDFISEEGKTDFALSLVTSKPASRGRIKTANLR
jgi:hypothetical protein